MATPNIFGINLAGIVADAFDGLLFDQTLIVVTSVRDPDDSSKTIKTTVRHPCQGFVDEFSAFERKGTNIKFSDNKIIILGATLPQSVVPNSGDNIEAEGSTFTINKDGVSRDPAGATYTCVCR